VDTDKYIASYRRIVKTLGIMQNFKAEDVPDADQVIAMTEHLLNLVMNDAWKYNDLSSR
jgi:hypothetical protein